ncbi:solute carrier family 23 member 1-like [Orbicella faveolata]|uniref:solute carrier family 23 member 1-like n=1 Tax=Orbicella faveolata TaxID=48498 RepID=UPI0009E20E1E|nr:solute carrier family 23 member 1-like [Orbicella faveolata]
MARQEIELKGVEPDAQPRPQKKTRPFGMSYLIDENPPWYVCLLLGFQHYLTMLGGTLAIPYILSGPMCFANNTLAISEVLSTIFFVSGLVTLMQTTFGVRLPIVQGGDYGYLAPIFAIMALPQWKCPIPQEENSNSTESSLINNDDIWKTRMREVRFLVLKFILTLLQTACIVIIILFCQHWGISMTTIVLISLFSQYLTKIKIPVPGYSKERGGFYTGHFPMFRLFPVILAIVVSWIICAIITAAGGFPSDPSVLQYAARTDARADVLKEAKWFRLPYPGQWGMPTVSVAAVFGMLAGVLSSIIESVGDYYACARLSGAPPPPKHAINRGIGIEGIGCLLAGAFGSGSGTTSYSQNIGAIGITKVGSLRVIQFGALVLMAFGLLGKIGALFVSIPDPIVGGVFMVMFGMIAAVGISNLQFADMNSSRNLFIVGFSIVFGLALPHYMVTHPGAIQTGVPEIDQIITVLMSTSMAVGGLVGLILDNTIPGTIEERGLKAWRQHLSGHSDDQFQTASIEVYDLPFGLNRISNYKVAKYLPFLPYNDEDSSPAADVELKNVNSKL